MKRIALIATLILVSATPAFAHAGHGIASGFLHPFFGWDHLIAMLAVGAWGATLGARAMWAVPAAFVSAMIVGGLFGMSGIEVPFVETMILASVLVLAGFAAARSENADLEWHGDCRIVRARPRIRPRRRNS